MVCVGGGPHTDAAGVWARAGTLRERMPPPCRARAENARGTVRGRGRPRAAPGRRDGRRAKTARDSALRSEAERSGSGVPLRTVEGGLRPWPPLLFGSQPGPELAPGPPVMRARGGRSRPGGAPAGRLRERGWGGGEGGSVGRSFFRFPRRRRAAGRDRRRRIAGEIDCPRPLRCRLRARRDRSVDAAVKYMPPLLDAGSCC